VIGVLRERDRRLARRGLRDLDRVVDRRADLRLREGVRRSEPEAALHEDPHADPLVLADVQGVEDPVLQDELLLHLMLVPRLRVRGALRPGVVDREVDEILTGHVALRAGGNAETCIKVSRRPARRKSL